MHVDRNRMLTVFGKGRTRRASAAGRILYLTPVWLVSIDTTQIEETGSYRSHHANQETAAGSWSYRINIRAAKLS